MDKFNNLKTNLKLWSTKWNLSKFLYLPLKPTNKKWNKVSKNLKKNSLNYLNKDNSNNKELNLNSSKLWTKNPLKLKKLFKTLTLKSKLMELSILNSTSPLLNILLKPLKSSPVTLKLPQFYKKLLPLLDNKPNNNKLPLDKLCNNNKLLLDKLCNNKLFLNMLNNNNTKMEDMLLTTNSFLNNNTLPSMNNNKWWCKILIWTTQMKTMVNMKDLLKEDLEKELISKKLNGLDLMNGSKKLKEIKIWSN